MATDLSKIIQDGLGTTLTGLLGRDTSFRETTKVDQRDISSFEFLQVNSEFAFDKLNTIFEFYIPASSASIIFNTMMSAEEYDIATTIDDDTADAMTEFVSNLSGGLVTAFNTENIEELGNAKFNIQHQEILKGDTIQNIENLFRFSINIEETPVLLFIRFHEVFLPYIENISNSEVTFYPEEKEEEEELEETPSSDAETKPKDNTTLEDMSSEEDKDTIETPSKFNKFLTKRNKLILATVVGTLLIIIIWNLLTPQEEPPQEETNTTTEQTQEEKPVKEVETTAYKTLKKVDFSINDIDIQRLNNRLNTLTKYQVLSEAELEQQKIEEQLRLDKLKKEQELIAFAKLNKEEPIELPKKEEQNSSQQPKEENQTIEMVVKEEPKEELIQAKQEIEVQNIEFFYLSTYNIKYNLYKNLILENDTPDVRISICNDKDGRTSLFIGPFETDIAQMKMKTLIEKKDPSVDTTLLKMTKEDFDQKCNF